MPLERLLAAAGGDERRALLQLGDERLHAGASPLEGLVPLDLRRQESHASTSVPRKTGLLGPCDCCPAVQDVTVGGHEERIEVLRGLRDMDLDSEEFGEAMAVLAEVLTELDARAADRQVERLRGQLRLVPLDDPREL
jgi:hypothetical protein